MTETPAPDYSTEEFEDYTNYRKWAEAAFVATEAHSDDMALCTQTGIGWAILALAAAIKDSRGADK